MASGVVPHGDVGDDSRSSPQGHASTSCLRDRDGPAHAASIASIPATVPSYGRRKPFGAWVSESTNQSFVPADVAANLVGSDGRDTFFTLRLATGNLGRWEPRETQSQQELIVPVRAIVVGRVA